MASEREQPFFFGLRPLALVLKDFCRWRTMARRSAALFLLFCCSVSRGRSEASVPPPAVISPALPVLWDELRGLKELVLSLKAEEVGRRQILRRVESWLRDGEVEAEQQRRSLEGLKEEALRQAEELRRRVEELEEQSKARDADVSTLQSRLNSSERSTDDLKKKNSALAAELPFLQTRLRASESTVEQLRRKNAVLAARLCNAESLMEELRRQISEFPASNASSLTPDVLELEARLGARLEELSADAEALRGGLKSLQETLKPASDLQQLSSSPVESADVSALGSRLSDAERRLDELHTQTSAVRASLEENLSAVKTQVQQLELTSTAQTDSVKQLQLKLNSTEHQIHELQTETSDQSSKLTKLQTNASASLQGDLNTEMFTRLRRGDKQLEQLLSEHTEIMNKLRDGEKQLEQLKAEHTAQTDSVKQLQLKLNSTEHQIHELQTETSGELRVAFSAGLTDSGSVGPFDEETTLIFSKVITNVGEAYNQTAGVFTAPVRGLYVFSFTAADYLKGYMGLYLYKNDRPIVFSLDLNDHGGYASTSNAVCLQLEEGDRVRLGLPASYRLYDDSRNFSVFSGFLLFHL
ncbi:restin homolog isoform X9 [Pelmatolapia mariae]|uniref:restin homolog isoform X9 n=1 Tax=Pelmatolapia mariae TaxID=158779 RepID=UPI002FE5AB88